ncbi:MAG: hypothetical protein BroJett014_03730 [Planctomycetota bacterium]|nr:MAG: hypothetical protein BroJett014_03730 [Planctomycetota bacterium]
MEEWKLTLDFEPSLPQFGQDVALHFRLGDANRLTVSVGRESDSTDVNDDDSLRLIELCEESLAVSETELDQDRAHICIDGIGLVVSSRDGRGGGFRFELTPLHWIEATRNDPRMRLTVSAIGVAQKLFPLQCGGKGVVANYVLQCMHRT